MKNPHKATLIITLVFTAVLTAIAWWSAYHPSDNANEYIGAASGYLATPSPSPSPTSTWSPTPTPTPTPTYSPQPWPTYYPQPTPAWFYPLADTIPPSTPQSLNIADMYQTGTNSGSLILTWSGISTDNVAVAGYKIYRNGVLVNQVGPDFPSSPYATVDLPNFSVAYVYTITAIDAAGNESAQSNPAAYEAYRVGTRVSINIDIIRENRNGADYTYTTVLPRGSRGTIVANPRTVGGYKTWPVAFDNSSYQDSCTEDTSCYGIEGWSYYSYDDNNGTAPLVKESFLTVLPPADTIFPLVSVTSPTSGAVLTGTANLTANATDNVGVAGVRFFIDNVANGVEDTSSPYQLTWNSTLVPNGPHYMHAVARDAAGNSTVSPTVPFSVNNGTGLDPTKKPWQNFTLWNWKLQATAKSGTTDYTMRRLASSASDAQAVEPWFYTNPNGSMAFWLDAAKQWDGTWYRSELREIMNESSNGINWSAMNGTSTMTARIKIPFVPTYNASTTQITILQIHPYYDGTPPAQYTGKPLFRLAWYPLADAGRHLKVHYKTDAYGNADAAVPCATTLAGVDQFIDAEVIVANGKLTVRANGQPCLTNFAIHPGWVWENYFKAGNYASQSWAGIGRVDFYGLNVTHTHPGI